MTENRDIDDFALSEDEMSAIDALGAGEARRTCPDPASVV
jgi:diketogulonate reductase-like aldo/keto reductase